MTIQMCRSIVCVVGLAIACAACTDGKAPNPDAVAASNATSSPTPEQAKTELLKLSCEMAATGNGEDAWKKENPQKAKRWQELGDIVAKYMETLPAGQKEKYSAEVFSGALACANASSPSPDNEASAAEQEQPHQEQEQASASGWESMHGSSPMDGESYSAVREFHFDDRQAMIAVRVYCLVEAKKLGLSLHSFVGSPNKPEPQSGFVAEPARRSLMYLYRAPGENDLSHAPVGRMRVNHGTPVSMARNFAMSRTSANEASFVGFTVLDANPMLARNGVQVDEEGGKHFQNGTVNWNALVSQLFPIDLEISNGSGTFNIALDRSPEVAAVFETCGANDPVYVENSQG